MTPDRGAYVSYDHRLMVGALTGGGGRAGAVAIGEDLGTVDPWIRRYLAGQRVLGTEMAWFAREPDGSPLRPPHWRRAAWPRSARTTSRRCPASSPVIT